jgi:hypothetical protein
MVMKKVKRRIAIGETNLTLRDRQQLARENNNTGKEAARGGEREREKETARGWTWRVAHPSYFYTHLIYCCTQHDDPQPNHQPIIITDQFTMIIIQFSFPRRSCSAKLNTARQLAEHSSFSLYFFTT